MRFIAFARMRFREKVESFGGFVQFWTTAASRNDFLFSRPKMQQFFFFWCLRELAKLFRTCWPIFQFVEYGLLRWDETQETHRN